MLLAIAIPTPTRPRQPVNIQILTPDPISDGLVNDHEHAFLDLRNQLPDHVREAFWPTPPANEEEDSGSDDSASGGDEDGGGDDSGMGSSQGIDMSSPGAESEFTKRRQREEQEEEQRRGPSIGM